MPKIYVASDHAGFALKGELIAHLSGLGHDVSDLGARELDPNDDYPAISRTLAERVAAEPGAFGFVIGGSGQGEAMAANRVPGIRAAVFYGPVSAQGAVEIEGTAGDDAYDIVRLARRHNDANVLSIGARFVSAEDAKRAAEIFLATDRSEEARHARRIASLG